MLRFGKATKVSTTRSVAHVSHNIALRKAAKKSLNHFEIRFSGAQALAIARGFRKASEEIDLRIYACSILPSHVHLVVAPNRVHFQFVAGRLKSFATRSLRDEGIDPMNGRFDGSGNPQSPSGSKLWKVYINDEQHLRKAVQYVERNPLKEGKRVQRWSFVVPFASAPSDAPRRRGG